MGKKDEDVRESVTSTKNFTLNELSDVLHDIESTKGTMLEAATN